MSSINKNLNTPFYMILCLTLSGCAGGSAFTACDLGSAAAATVQPRPAWVNQTAFEMRLPRGYYYGKGASSERTSYAKRRDAAHAQAYGDIARRVSVQIFSRQVVQTTNAGTRAEAVTKAISDLNASGIETIREWQDNTSCTFHVMARVPEKVALSWKRAAESYLVERPGLGLVRRADEDVYRLRYREEGQPSIFIEWAQEVPGAALQEFAPGAGAVFQNAVRRHLKQHGINKFSAQKTSAKIVIRLGVAGISRETFVVRARLLEAGGKQLASAVGDGDYRGALSQQTFMPSRDEGFEPRKTPRPDRSTYIKQVARALTLNLIRDWLDNDQTTRR